MKKNLRQILKTASDNLARDIVNLDFEQLSIEDYTIIYLSKYLDNIKYELNLNADILFHAFEHTGLKMADLVLVDYGSGIGMLSLLAKYSGVGKVIQVDINKDVLSDSITLSNALKVFDIEQYTSISECVKAEGSDSINAIVSRDVVEHVYDLKALFDQFAEINTCSVMVHNTSANRYNLWLKSYFRKIHNSFEEEVVINSRDGNISPSYASIRSERLSQLFPDLDTRSLDMMTAKTRGLMIVDFENLSQEEILKLNPPLSNTCNPITGNWAERLLSVSDYRSLSGPFDMSIASGILNYFGVGPVFWGKELLNIFNKRGLTGPALWPSIHFIYKRR